MKIYFVLFYFLTQSALASHFVCNPQTIEEWMGFEVEIFFTKSVRINNINYCEGCNIHKYTYNSSIVTTGFYYSGIHESPEWFGFSYGGTYERDKYCKVTEKFGPQSKEDSINPNDDYLADITCTEPNRTSTFQFQYSGQTKIGKAGLAHNKKLYETWKNKCFIVQ